MEKYISIPLALQLLWRTPLTYFVLSVDRRIRHVKIIVLEKDQEKK
jgi:hypothetical protein